MRPELTAHTSEFSNFFQGKCEIRRNYKGRSKFQYLQRLWATTPLPSFGLNQWNWKLRNGMQCCASASGLRMAIARHIITVFFLSLSLSITIHCHSCHAPNRLPSKRLLRIRNFLSLLCFFLSVMQRLVCV